MFHLFDPLFLLIGFNVVPAADQEVSNGKWPWTKLSHWSMSSEIQFFF
jgi:hypothetical protein